MAINRIYTILTSNDELDATNIADSFFGLTEIRNMREDDVLNIKMEILFLLILNHTL